MEKYIILGSKHSALLAVDVNKHIKKGYVPIGGVDILSSTGSLPPHFYQAMMLKQGELGVITVDSPVKQCHEEIKKNLWPPLKNNMLASIDIQSQGSIVLAMAA